MFPFDDVIMVCLQSNAVSRDQGATGPVGGTFDLTFVAADTGLQETKTGDYDMNE